MHYDQNYNKALSPVWALVQAASQAAEACEEAHPGLEEDVAHIYDRIEEATLEQQKELEERAVALARRQVGVACDLLPLHTCNKACRSRWTLAVGFLQQLQIWQHGVRWHALKCFLPFATRQGHKATRVHAEL
jgi:hypothetical protein